MNEKYVCGFCGKTHYDLDEYMNCVLSCGEKLKKLKKEEKEKKYLEEMNADLNGVKQAKAYYEQKLNEFKEKYPEEYELNFGSENTCICPSDCKGYKGDAENTEDNTEDDNYVSSLFTYPESIYLAKLLGIL